MCVCVCVSAGENECRTSVFMSVLPISSPLVNFVCKKSQRAQSEFAEEWKTGLDTH